MSRILYVQLWENRLRVIEPKSNKYFDDLPLVAVEKGKDGRLNLLAIGSACHSISDSNVSIINPFSHPRMLVSNFIIAELLIGYVFRQILGRGLFSISPKVVIQPMEKLDGGISEIEEKVFTELCIGAGAKEVVVYAGCEQNVEEIDYAEFVKNVRQSIRIPSKNRAPLVLLAWLLILAVFIFLKRS